MLLGWRVAVKLRAGYVRVGVVATAIGVDGPKHGADHAGVASGLAQLIRGSSGSFAGDDVVHRLTDDVRRRVSGEEADGDLTSRQGWEELLRITSNVEAVQQEFSHGCMIVDRA